MYLTSNKLNGKFKKKENAQNVCNHGLSRKVAWIRALVHRVTKICSTQQLLQLEILNIKGFTSWKGFPRWICGKLIHTYTAKSIKATPDDSELEPTIPIIWTKLPFIGNKGNFLLRNCTRKIFESCEPLENHRMQQFHFSERSYAETLQSSVVYKFVCPGCNASYIGKTDGCLYTPVNEHAKSEEIYNHVNDCEHFEHDLSLLNLPFNLLDVK